MVYLIIEMSGKIFFSDRGKGKGQGSEVGMCLSVQGMVRRLIGAKREGGQVGPRSERIVGTGDSQLSQNSCLRVVLNLAPFLDLAHRFLGNSFPSTA